MKKLLADMPPRVFRATDKHTGWKEIFTPADNAMHYLSYARLIFGAGVKQHRLQTAGQEYAVFCIKPEVTVTVGREKFNLALHDMLYIPRNSEVLVEGEAGADVALAYCPSDMDSTAQLVRYQDIKDDPAFFFDVGTPEMGTKRRIHNMLGHNVKASRLLAGFTIGQPTAWTSWPPHEHSTSKEEFYLFFDMPAPAFSVQFVYSSPQDVEFKEIVQGGDCVTVPAGFHPTCAAPGFQSVFLWVMAAFDPKKDRDFKHGIRLQPEFEAVKFL